MTSWRRIVATITQPHVIEAILAALGMPTGPAVLPPARGPPELLERGGHPERSGERGTSGGTRERGQPEDALSEYF
jgi:hypothetical protein